jgi:hypothetical protein
MIIQWKPSGPQHYVAVWQGHHLSLEFTKAIASPPWRVWVDDVLMQTVNKGQKAAYWWTPTAAMEAMDAVANRLVLKAGETAHARQRPTSAERITRHANVRSE